MMRSLSSEAASVQPDHRQFGRYTLLYRFAAGGMANLYLARFAGSDGFEKLVAIKLIHGHLTEDPAFVRMFIDEARLASAISHANVAQVIELGKVGQTHYIAMEYVEGESVSALMRRTKPSLRCCARIIADAAAGLHAAHELKTRGGELRHVVHRDVSPQNILISYDGQVKVVDFGVARARGLLHDTDGGTVKGKFAYMAPEQAKAQPVDRRADVFALGILLYEMSVRQRLFKGENSAETLRKMMHDEIKLPSKLVGPGYPSSLEKIVLKALDRDPEGRFQTARELQGALEQFIIESGGPFLPADVGELMSQLFADQIKTKRKILERCDQDSSDVVPDVDLVTSSTSMPTITTGHAALGGGLEPAAPAPTRRSLRVPIAVSLVVLLGLGLAAYFVTTRPKPTSPEATAAPAAKLELLPAVVEPSAAKITIEIRATPKSATIVFDGKAVANPFSETRDEGEGAVRAVVSAPGYKSKQLDIALNRSGTWTVGLERAAASSDIKPAVRKKRQRNRRRWPTTKRKGGFANDDVLKDNPYGP
jgi:eukaryotic-like serine/threonine-protein kinase